MNLTFVMHNIRKLVAISICCFFWLPFVASAQQVDQAGICTDDFQIASSDRSNEFFTIVGQPDLYIGANDDTLLLPDVSAALPMHTRLQRIGETEFRLLFRTNKKLYDGRRVCGWINKTAGQEDVLPVFAERLKVGTPVDWTDPVTGKTRELENPLPLKALLRSNPQFDSDDATLVSIYDRPTITSNTRTDASVFGIYYVYAERLTANNEYWYWIAGEDPDVPTPFAGWVSQEFVLLWESQLSLFFNDNDQNDLIFATRDFAANNDATGVLGQRPDKFEERSLGEAKDSEFSSKNIARFPILNEESSANGRGQTIYRIGFFGDGGQLEQTSEIGNVQIDIRNIDILFVLDNTLSMTEYFSSVVQAVRNSAEVIKQINEQEGYDVNVKYAAATYGDYLSDDARIGNVQFDIVSNLGLPGYTEHLGKLTDIAERGDYFRDSMDDRPEAGLAGVLLGVETLEWTSDARFKVVVWIGDHGSRDFEDREGLTVSFVKERLVKSNVLLLPINVSGRYDTQWNNQFIRQGDQLAGTFGLKTKIAHDGGQSDDYNRTQEFIEEAIANMYVSSLVSSITLRDRTNISQTIKEQKDLFDLIPAAESDVAQISKAICEMAFGSKGCDNIRASKQFMAEGYVLYDERYENYDFWVNLTFDNLDILSRVLELTCDGFDRGNVKRYIEQAMVVVQTTMGGDRYRSDIPIGEFLRRYLLLPSNHFPSFLESTPDKIDELWQQARNIDSENGDLVETTQIADPICRSAAMLAIVSDKKRLKDPAKDLVRASSLSDRASYEWTVADTQSLVDFDWEWAQGGENNFYYIPVSFLPGRVSAE